uniref:Uncharacterized protein n=1 Tax=Globisporangium ultimum (strain ATCC 200006 / CBS 805.95 / DAOM BR144) TaxID=431595 RepID=K3X7N0_GLOUD
CSCSRRSNRRSTRPSRSRPSFGTSPRSRSCSSASARRPSSSTRRTRRWRSTISALKENHASDCYTQNEKKRKENEWTLMEKQSEAIRRADTRFLKEGIRICARL